MRAPERFQSFIERKRREHGVRFDPSELASAFVPYFESQERVRVRLKYGEEMTGTIGVTTGWRPAFLLMRSSRALGSSVVLSSEASVIAVKRGRKYVTLAPSKPESV